MSFPVSMRHTDFDRGVPHNAAMESLRFLQLTGRRGRSRSSRWTPIPTNVIQNLVPVGVKPPRCVADLEHIVLSDLPFGIGIGPVWKERLAMARFRAKVPTPKKDAVFLLPARFTRLLIAERREVPTHKELDSMFKGAEETPQEELYTLIVDGPFSCLNGRIGTRKEMLQTAEKMLENNEITYPSLGLILAKITRVGKIRLKLVVEE